MNKRILQQKKAAAVAAAKALNATAAAEKRDLTAEELTQFDAHMAEASSLQANIERAEKLEAADVGMVVADDAVISVDGQSEAAKDPKGGFKFVGEFMKAVVGASQAGRNGTAVDKRLQIGAATPGVYSGEANGADGGFILPPDFANEIFQLSLTDNALLPMTDEVTVVGNSMAFPRDETTPWGTSGVRAYWQGEGSAATATKPVFGQDVLRLKKLMALVPVSDEMLEDSSALASYLPKKIGASIQWKINEAILFGAGNGTPVGALSGGAVVTVPKDAGQVTKTLSPTNLANMIARLPEGSYPNSFWLINPDVLPSLFTLNNGNQMLYVPYGGGKAAFAGNPYGMLLGRPIIISQHASGFSSQGDVTLLDLSYYQTISKSGGVQSASSMHLYFDSDATAFRTTFRMDGQSKISTPIVPAKSANPLSPFVQLGAR